MDTDVASAANVGRRVYWLRSYLGLNQTEFAASIGVAQSNLSNWETGRQRLSINEALKISGIYNVPLDFLYLDRRRTLDSDMLKSVSVFDFNRTDISKSSE